MKVTKEYLQQVIKEEVEKMVVEGELEEGFLDRMGARVGSAVQGVKGGLKGAVAGGVKKAAGIAGLGDVEKAAGATQASIGAETKKKQLATKIKQVVLPKLIDMEKDTKIIFKDNLEDKTVQNVLTLVNNLKNNLSKFTTAAGIGGRNPAAEKPEEPELGGAGGPSEE